MLLDWTRTAQSATVSMSESSTNLPPLTNWFTASSILALTSFPVRLNPNRRAVSTISSSRDSPCDSSARAKTPAFNSGRDIC